jgi:hypothetical protein
MATIASKINTVGGKVGGTLSNVLKRYGAEIAIAVVTGFLSNIVTDKMSKKGKGSKKRKKK